LSEWCFSMSNKPMKRTLALSLAFILAEALGPFTSTHIGDANVPKAVEISRDSHFRLLKENPDVRVWMMELRPGEKTNLVSRDHDFLQIPLDEGWMSTSIEGKQAIPFWAEKKPRFVRGSFSQIVQNNSKIIVRIVEVEFIKSVGAERCGPEAQVSCGCWGAVGGIITPIGCRLLETDYVAISQMEAHPGGGLGLAVPALVVPVDSIKIRPTSNGDAASIVRPGEVLWMDKTAQTIESLDQHATAKAVTVEFKSHTADLATR
jgi:hypothetical protein